MPKTRHGKIRIEVASQGISGKRFGNMLTHLRGYLLNYTLPPFAMDSTEAREETLKLTSAHATQPERARMKRYCWLGSLYVDEAAARVVSDFFPPEDSHVHAAYRTLRHHSIVQTIAQRADLCDSETQLLDDGRKTAAERFNTFVYLLSIGETARLLGPWLDSVFRPIGNVLSQRLSLLNKKKHAVAEAEDGHELSSDSQLPAAGPSNAASQRTVYWPDTDADYIFVHDSDSADKDADALSSDPEDEEVSQDSDPTEGSLHEALVTEVGDNYIDIFIGGEKPQEHCVLMDECQAVVQDYALKDSVMIITWRSTSFREDDDEDDDICFETFTSRISPGKRILVKFPLEDSQEDRTRPPTIAHPLAVLSVGVAPTAVDAAGWSAQGDGMKCKTPAFLAGCSATKRPGDTRAEGSTTIFSFPPPLHVMGKKDKCKSLKSCKPGPPPSTTHLQHLVQSILRHTTHLPLYPGSIHEEVQKDKIVPTSLSKPVHRRYEWLGDKCVNRYVALALSAIVPIEEHNTCNVIHGILKSNLVFAAIAYKTGLVDELSLSKRPADELEEYVYALSVHKMSSLLGPWLHAVFRPLAVYLYERLHKVRSPAAEEVPPQKRRRMATTTPSDQSQEATTEQSTGPQGVSYRVDGDGYIVIDDTDSDADVGIEERKGKRKRSARKTQ